MRLAHQSHSQSLFERVDESLEMLRRVKRENFGIIYEPANLELCGEDYGAETIKVFAPYMFNVYLQNHRLSQGGKDVMATWSRGDVRFGQTPIWDVVGIDFPLIFNALEEIGYNGYVTMHQAFAGLHGPQDAIVRSARYLRSIGGVRELNRFNSCLSNH